MKDIDLMEPIGHFCWDINDAEEAAEWFGDEQSAIDVIETYQDVLLENHYEDYKEEYEGNGCLDFIAVEYFPDIRYEKVIEEYLREQGKNPEDTIRGYAKANEVMNIGSSGFLMEHGVNYDWQDKDLLGGDGSGQELAKFQKFCREKMKEMNNKQKEREPYNPGRNAQAVSQSTGDKSNYERNSER